MSVQKSIRAFLALVGVTALLVTPAAGSARLPPLPVVTLITDSVAGALLYNEPGQTILRQGIDLDLQVGTCRRVELDSCTDDSGVQPQTLIQLVQSLGSTLGPTVIVAVGYNDYASHYAQDIEDALAALEQAGVQRVIWLTLRAAKTEYLPMNDDIFAAAQAHPELVVADWNLYSRSHPDWFRSDGIHFQKNVGMVALGTFLHDQLVKLGIPIPPVRILASSLPAAHDGQAYTTALGAQGGRPPYVWSALSRLPTGLQLTSTGRLTGVVTARPGTYDVSVQVADTAHDSAQRQVALKIRAT